MKLEGKVALITGGNSGIGSATAALLASSTLQVWLSLRNMGYVKNRRNQVPEAFRDTVPLEDHQKAADYTLAKGSFGLVELLYGALLILFWTVGGGLDYLDELWRVAELGTTATGVCVVVSAFLIVGILDMPFSAYDTFSLETRFGFNRTTIRTFVSDHLLHGLVVALLGVPPVWVILFQREADRGYNPWIKPTQKTKSTRGIGQALFNGLDHNLCKGG